MHEAHSHGVNGNASRTKQSDGCGGSVESNEMHINIAVIIEGSGDRQAGGERADKYVDLLPGVLCEFAVNG